MKNYILDTNILLTDSNSIFNFEDNHVIIPMIVIEELDRHKDRQDEAGKNARDLSRFLSNLLIDSSEVKKVKLFTGGLLSIVSTEEYNSINLNISSDLDMKYGDNKIILFSLKCQKFNFSNYQEETVLVSRDLLLRVKGTAFGLKVEDYKKENVIKTKDELYTGSKIIESVDLDISKMYQDAKDNNGTFAFLLNEELYPNEFIIFKNGNTSIITRYLGNNLYKKVSDSASSFKLKAKNKEQLMALDLLLDPDIKLVTLAGKSGTGKTVCALAAGLEQTSLNPTSKSGGNKQYQSLVCMKPTVSVGREMGFLPGPQPLYEKVLTIDGWKEMRDIEIGDSVMTRYGKTAKVIKCLPQGLLPINKVIFEDGANVEVSNKHLWTCYIDNIKQTISTKEIKEALNNNKKVKIDFIKPLHFSKKELCIPPYILGALLGDGCLTQKHVIEFSGADKEIIEKINSLLPELIYLKDCKKYKWRFVMKEKEGRKFSKNRNWMLTKIIDSGLHGTNSYNKYIPQIYKESSIEDRLELLKGLMDTDGYVSKDGFDVSYTTVSKQLAEDFKELVLSLGGYSNIKYSELKHAYTVSVSFWDGTVPFSLSRKILRYKSRLNERKREIVDIIECDKKTEMKCISIDDSEHLYITSGYVLTHNSKEEKMEPWLAPIKDNLRYLIGQGKKDKMLDQTLNMYFENGIIEVEAISFIRGRSIANAFIIIDETQNITHHELKTILTRVGDNTKIILLGDPEQSDVTHLNALNNGLSIAIEKFKEYSIAGHVTLEKGERSELATISSKILG